MYICNNELAIEQACGLTDFGWVGGLPLSGVQPEKRLCCRMPLASRARLASASSRWPSCEAPAALFPEPKTAGQVGLATAHGPASAHWHDVVEGGHWTAWCGARAHGMSHAYTLGAGMACTNTLMLSAL
eukprot:366486-Chlamydomonas_euryale.AAC.18